MRSDRTSRAGSRRIALAVAVLAVAVVVVVLFGAERRAPEGARASAGGQMQAMTGTVRIGYLHHSTGGIIWAGGMNRRLHRVWNDAVPDSVKSTLSPLHRGGGVPDFIREWNAENGTDYRIRQLTYPSAKSGYPWANYPYDYWNLWVAHRGAERDRGELNLDDLAQQFDVVVLKHCFPVSRIVEDRGGAAVSSPEKTLANYRLQYQALKERLREFPEKRFIVWTGAALTEKKTTPDQARRAREFFDWVKTDWDEKGDNIFVWDLFSLEADERGYLESAHAASPTDSHPNAAFARKVAPLVGRRIVDVIEGRGDTAALDGAAAPLRAAR